MKKEYAQAISLYETFLKEYPAHYLSDNALFGIGECKLKMKRFYEATGIFKEVVEKYPDGNKVADALWSIGTAYLAMDDPENARAYLSRVAQEYPATQSGILARKKLQIMQPFRRQKNKPSNKKNKLQVYLHTYS